MHGYERSNLVALARDHQSDVTKSKHGTISTFFMNHKRQYEQDATSLKVEDIRRVRDYYY